MSMVIPAQYHPLREIRTNQRFATFEGWRENKKVFIKTAVDPQLRERIAVKAYGLKAMRELDPGKSLYYVPSVLAL